MQMLYIWIQSSSAEGARASRKSSTTSLSQGTLHAASACSNTPPCLLAHAHLTPPLDTTNHSAKLPSCCHVLSAQRDKQLASPAVFEMLEARACLLPGAAQDAQQRLLANSACSCNPAAGVPLSPTQGLRQASSPPGSST